MKYGDFDKYGDWIVLSFLTFMDKKYFMSFYLKYITVSQKIRF